MDSDILSLAFRDASLKVYRAKRHIDEAQRNLALYVEQDFCKLIEERNAGGGQAFFVETQPTPANLLLATGDAFHCLSTAFDYIMTGAMRAKVATTTRIGFPSHETRDDFEKSFSTPEPGKKAPPNRRIGEAFPGFLEFLLDKIQPYRGGDLAIWETRKADNIDKHNLVIPTLAMGTRNGILLTDDANDVRVGINAHVRAGGRIKPIVQFGPGNNIEIKQKGDPTLCVTFPDGAEVFAGDSILPTLTQSYQLAIEAVELLADHFGAPKHAVEFLRATD